MSTYITSKPQPQNHKQRYHLKENSILYIIIVIIIINTSNKKVMPISVKVVFYKLVPSARVEKLKVFWLMRLLVLQKKRMLIDHGFFANFTLPLM